MDRLAPGERGLGGERESFRGIPKPSARGIERARQNIERDLRANVSQALNWRSFVRRHPGACFTAALVAGALVARAITR